MPRKHRQSRHADSSGKVHGAGIVANDIGRPARQSRDLVEVGFAAEINYVRRDFADGDDAVRLGLGADGDAIDTLGFKAFGKLGISLGRPAFMQQLRRTAGDKERKTRRQGKAIQRSVEPRQIGIGSLRDVRLP